MFKSGMSLVKRLAISVCVTSVFKLGDDCENQPPTRIPSIGQIG